MPWSHFARSDSQWGKHSQQEEDEREGELCRQGGSQQEGALLKGCLSPKDSGNFPWLKNDFKTLSMLVKSTSHADSVYSGGDYFDLWLPHESLKSQ